MVMFMPTCAQTVVLPTGISTLPFMYHLRSKGAPRGWAGVRQGAPRLRCGAARAGALASAERWDFSPLVAAAEGAGRPLQLVAAQVDLESGPVPEELGRGHLHRLLDLLDILRRLIARFRPARRLGLLTGILG